MRLEFWKTNSEFRDYCVCFVRITWVTANVSNTKHTVISEFGIRFEKLKSHVCGNELYLIRGSVGRAEAILGKSKVS
jgi:hypothetical protein